MTYQPVYGLVSDENCCRSTSSRYGKVNQVDFKGLTHFGTAIGVCLTSDGSLPRKDVEEAEHKILKWAEKLKFKRMENWSHKLVERKKYNDEQDKMERADIDITIPENDKLHYTINGVKISKKILSFLKNDEEFLNKLEIANTLKNEEEK